MNLKNNYQDIEKRTFNFAIDVIKLINMLPKSPGNQVIGFQEIKAATSINSNVIQGRSGVSRKDFITSVASRIPRVSIRGDEAPPE